MLTAIVTHKGGHVEVRVTPASAPAESEETTTTVAGEATTTEDTTMAAENTAASGEEHTTATVEEPNPILPDNSEIAWTAGTFIVLLVIMRYFLYPRLRKGMDSRYTAIRENRESADQVRAAAQSDVAEYEKALAAARAEAAARLDAARQTVDNERNARLAEVNSRIAAARAEADQKTTAARAAAQGEIASAVGQVASRIAEIALGKAPDQSVVSSAVSATMEGAR